MTTIDAKRFLDPQGRIVASGQLLADEVARALSQHDVVQINFGGMRGLPSSYFNVLLQRIIPVANAQDFCRRVMTCFDSTAQEQVFRRSFESVTRGAA